MRHRCRLSSLALLSLVVAGNPAAAGELSDAEVALRTGRYSEAITLFETQLKNGASEPNREPLVRGLARALGTVGRYADAQGVLEEYVESHPDSAQLLNTLGETLYVQGKVDEARQAFVEAVARRAQDHLTARVNLGVLLAEQGDWKAADDHFYSLIDAYNSSSSLEAEELTAVGDACRRLGRNDPQLFKDALKAYDKAIAADPSYLEPRVRVGELFLEKYNSTEARQSLEAVLAVNPSHPEALLAMARVQDFESSPQAMEQIEKSLEVNPNFVAARVLRGQLLLKLEQYEEAAEEAAQALAVNHQDLAALSVLAAARYLQGDTAAFDQAQARVRKRNASYAELYNFLADAAVYNRLYREAADFARQAVSLDSRSWRGYGLLGLNELRLGDIDKGRRSLETSFAGDPYNVWIKNTLDLVDTFTNYRETESPRFRLVIEGQESELLTIYIAALAEEAYSQLAERYRYQPPTPIRIEVYPSHADFSVRTVGLAGLGALGVSFGPVIALDSPSAREIGSFSWGSTLWHELAHTFTLEMTDNKIPRWLTEGISVYEERLARPGWGDDVVPEFLEAFKAGKLLSLAEFNRGFVRPSFPEQIGFSYYQASLVCQLIEETYGHEALLGILDGYRRGLGTEEIFKEVLEIDLEGFDEKFNAYLENRFSTALAALKAPEPEKDSPMALLVPPSRENIAKQAEEEPGDFRSQLRYGLVLFGEDKLDEALPYLKRAKALFPEFAGDLSPYPYLAKIYSERGDKKRAAEELAVLTSIDETHYDAHMELAELLEELGDPKGAAAALERTLYIYPLRPGVHVRLAKLYKELGELQKVVRERQALVALHPVDRASALYELAVAHLEAGQTSQARRQVLKALEVAPSYREAQELLLRLRVRPSQSSIEQGRDREVSPSPGEAP